MKQLAERKRPEAEFHDQLRTGHLEQRWSLEAEKGLSGNREWSNFKWYCIERRSLDHVKDRLKKLCRGKAMLDYCCGNGSEALWLTRDGAREVVGIDISETSSFITTVVLGGLHCSTLDTVRQSTLESYF